MSSQRDACDTVLGLGLALALDGSSCSPPPKNHHPKQEPKLGDRSEFSLTLGLSEGPPSAARKIDAASEEQSAGSSFSAVKEEAEVERLSPRRRSVEEDEEGGARKKLRLTKEQSALLEERFREQSTLNPKQKIALAKQLNLRPRQVEVWFQNRRARTKLKQTEVDCEFLKRCCETLTDENRRLNRELQELRAIKLAAGPLYMHLPAAAISMCPSCERVTADGSKSAAAQKALLYQPFARSPSAAC